jgi:hypothetical protein
LKDRSGRRSVNRNFFAARPPSPRKYWTRKGIAHWLVEHLSDDIPTLVGIDHGFSFPLRYFEVHRLEPNWPAFLDDFQRHWPTDEDNTYVDFVRDGVAGENMLNMGLDSSLVCPYLSISQYLPRPI